MTGAWNDYNDAESQNSYDLIPKGTIVPVRMTLKPGGYDDPSQGWTGGYATRNETTGSVYLNAEFVVLEGANARRKIWSLIGLLSLKGPEWGNKHPLATTLVLRAMIDFSLGQARSSRYKHAARHLLECSSLSSAIEDFGGHETHEDYEARLRREHGRKSSFWSLVD